MTTPASGGIASAGGPSVGAVPTLAFTVTGASAEPYAAVPMIAFHVAVEAPIERPVRSVLLAAQVRIGVARRSYSGVEQGRLLELFGTPDRWGETLKSLLWTHCTTVVPSFEHRTTLKLLVPCTYDFDVAAAKYLDSLQGGDVPLDFLFSGSVFYDDELGRLQTARLSWESEAGFRMPVSVWRELMQHYFPDSGWVRLRRESFDRLYAFKIGRGLSSWDAAIEELVRGDAT